MTSPYYMYLPPSFSQGCTGHGKPGKSWNFTISFSRPGKSCNLRVGHGKSWNMTENDFSYNKKAINTLNE